MIGNVVGGYKILEKIGEGGMGAVYRGMDVMLEREVAIKSLRPELTHEPKVIERFRTEAVALARLNHPNILILYNFFREDPQYYMVLELARGETLDKLIKRCGPLPWQTAAPLIRQALAGLEHAHILKVIHRDIKPANLILTNTGLLKLMDFGIARIMEATRLTRAGHLVGTLEYMSPEQIQGRTIDARSDLYSVGVVLYEMLTGHIPFERQSDFELIKSHVEEYPTPPSAFMPQLPPALEKVVMRALAKNPEDRFPSAVAFRTALAGVTSVAPSGGEPQERALELPETRLYSETPLPQDTASSLSGAAPAETAFHSQPSSSVQKISSSYIKNYPGIIALVVLIALAAALVNMPHWAQSSAGNPAKLLIPSAHQNNVNAISGSSVGTTNPLLPEQAVSSKQSIGVTEKNVNPINAGGQAAGQPEQPASAGSPSPATRATAEQPAASEPETPAAAKKDKTDSLPIIATPSDPAASFVKTEDPTADETEKNQPLKKTVKLPQTKRATPIKSTIQAKTTPAKNKSIPKKKSSQPDAKRSTNNQRSSEWNILD